ncbi:zinc ABC transporter ATP-binding protein ZnuC [Oceaniserpentilla sp. 4NH20-0058]|uniref:metal ABC transporter ATP-binding protein n=1 Tax=Oceaniserpentilla sp. 4NH20-0058 TaxID=3127660 RepID=UPI0031062F04
MNDYLIKLRNVSFVRQGRTILKDINLSVHRGEIVTLIGPNGAGKSSLLKLALGLETISSGQRTCLPNLRIGYMPQKMSLPETLPLSVKHFLELAKGYHKSQLMNVCERLNITELLNRPMQKLSGGELQRTLLARALLSNPELLVLDEPVQGLDVSGQAELYHLISNLKDELNCGVLMVSHDLHLVMAATNKVICLNGHVCCEGHPQTVQNDPSYLELFGRSMPAHLVPYTHHHDHTHGEHCQHDHKEEH